MFRNCLVIALLIFTPLAAIAERQDAEDAPEWTIDPAHSSITFSVRHIFTPVYGSFSSLSGKLNFDPKNLSGSRMNVRIPVATISTRVDRRDSHLKSADFFDVEKYPDMTFVADHFRRAGKSTYKVTGDMTIHGVTKRITIPFRLEGIKAHPAKKGHQVAGAISEFVIKRNDFGVGSGSFAETAVIGDEVRIRLGIEAYQPDAP